MKQRTPYDIDRFDETSLTWKPYSHARSATEARNTLEGVKKQQPERTFRIRDKTGKRDVPMAT